MEHGVENTTTSTLGYTKYGRKDFYVNLLFIFVPRLDADSQSVSWK